MPVPGSTLEVGNPQTQTVSRRMQTTGNVDQIGYSTFVSESQKCNQLAYTSAANAFGALITTTLKPAPGYLRGLWLVVSATGGTGAVAVYSADAPYNAIQNVTLRDAFGAIVFQADGYGLFLINIYSGQVGSVNLQNPASSAFWVAQAATGNFTFALFLPLEL